MTIAIANRQKTVPIDRVVLRRAAKIVLRGEGVTSAEISLAFVDDPESARVNWEFLRHRGPTDVITFPLGSDPLVGELVIGAEVAGRVAGERGHATADELALYVIHGVLHLCGYDDKKAGPRKVMRGREAHYLAALGLPGINERT
ncbi:MAG: rRNA maturation RNase YbeY [Gemmataceae bacterium]|nr:rRNA maturation RNase YbeY [Gemmataceae bacterium]